MIEPLASCLEKCLFDFLASDLSIIKALAPTEFFRLSNVMSDAL